MDEQSLPIDINYGKLLEWLVSRRHIKSEWFKHEHVVHEKIRKAKVATGDAFKVAESPDYWEVCDYVAKAKGIQNSAASKMWYEVQRAYEKDLFYFGETAQRIARNVNYEIPALKRIVEKARRLEEECEQRAVDADANAVAFTNRFRASCTQHGITGTHVRDELAKRARDEAPGHFEGIVAGLRLLKDVIAFRDAFVHFTQRRTDESTSEGQAKLIRFIADRGNATVYELETGRSPPADVLKSLEAELNLQSKSDSGNEQHQDEEAEICWDIDEPTSSPADDLNIEIEVVESNVGDSPNITSESRTETQIDADRPTKAQLLTVLEDSDRRGALLNELFELEAFLHVRSLETTSSRIASDVIVTFELQTLADAVLNDPCWARKYADAEAQFGDWLATVRKCIEQLSNVRFVRTMRIRESVVYLERLAAQLDELRTHAAKNTRLAETMRARAREARQEHQQTQPLVRALADRTMALKRLTEAQISKKYKSRPVNILGEIYAVCSC